MKITSSDFENNQKIPITFTCDGDDINPHLIFDDIPGGTESLALIVTDPDAPGGTWTHWIVWNINPNTLEIGEDSVPEEAVEGLNSGGGQGYQGPCPPNGVHRYIFDLYALDIMLNLDPMSERSDLETEIVDHVVDKSQLVGLYGHEA